MNYIELPNSRLDVRFYFEAMFLERNAKCYAHAIRQGGIHDAFIDGLPMGTCTSNDRARPYLYISYVGRTM